MDKRIAQLLDLVKKTGDRLVIMPESGDPFVLMDLAKYKELLESRSSARRSKSNAKLMAQDLALWEQTKNDLGAISSAGGEPEVVSLESASPPNAEEKYYFEPVDSEESQAEATK